MKLTMRYQKQRQSDFVYTTLFLFAIVMIAFGVCSSPPGEILSGLGAILTQGAGLITDYVSIAGIGGAFVNGGIVMLIAVLLLRGLKVNFSGMSVACCFLMGGFALFGKNPLNILPILLGAWLYAKVQREHFGKFVYIALFGTTLSPIVTEILLLFSHWPVAARVSLAALIGVIMGFILPAIYSYTLRVHQGYNLYNVGFAAGLIGLVVVSLLRSFGNEVSSRLIWSTGNNGIFSAFLFTIFVLMFLLGFFANGRSFGGLLHLTRHSGRSVADFVAMDGYPVTLMNMGIVGAFATLYVLIVGGDLNGPTIGGILTIVGFGAFGKHMKNIVWVMLGVVISSFVMVWNLTDPSIMLAALFVTGLAPIAGHYGPIWGMIAGMIHASVVQNVGVLYGGLNLYNNGFAAGLVCIVLLPLIRALRKEEKDE